MTYKYKISLMPLKFIIKKSTLKNNFSHNSSKRNPLPNPKLIITPNYSYKTYQFNKFLSNSTTINPHISKPISKESKQSQNFIKKTKKYKPFSNSNSSKSIISKKINNPKESLEWLSISGTKPKTNSFKYSKPTILSNYYYKLTKKIS